MPRIAFLTPSLGVGGAERSLIRTANAIARSGADVTVIVQSKDAGEFDRFPLDSGIVRISLGARHAASPRTWLAAARALRRCQPDIVIGWSLYANLLACLASLGASSWKLVLSERCFLPLLLRGDPPQSGLRAVLRRAITKTAIKLLYRRADLITANSRESLDLLRDWIGVGRSYAVWSNMLDSSELVAAERAVASRTDRADVPDELRILAVGRLVWQKGFDLLLEAVARLPRTYDWTLTIVGSGPMEAQLRERASRWDLAGRVRFLGTIESLGQLFVATDIVAVPSRFEGFPNVPLEAMLHGCAVVVSDCQSGPRELTDGGRLAVLCAVDDVDGLRGGIEYLASSRALRLRLGIMARTSIRTTYSADAVAASLVESLSALGH